MPGRKIEMGAEHFGVRVDEEFLAFAPDMDFV